MKKLCKYRVRVIGSWKDGSVTTLDLLVDSGFAVTAVSQSFYNTLVEAGAPVGELRPTVRKLCGANGSQINISGCSSCVVSFLGLRAEFPILVCDLSTDAIIGTDTLGSILPHTLDIRNGLLFTDGGVSLQLQGLTVFSENTGLVVGRTLVDPSGRKVPVLVSNFGQETVMVEPFSEIGMIAQVSAIQPTMNHLPRPACDPSALPDHLRDCWSVHRTIWMTYRRANWLTL